MIFSIFCWICQFMPKNRQFLMHILQVLQNEKSQLFGSPKFCTRNRLAEWSRILHCLNNQEFRNPVMVRYDWAISEMPSFYACRKKNSVDHALSIIMQERWLGSNPSSQGNQRCRSHHNERSRMHRCGDRAWSS